MGRDDNLTWHSGEVSRAQRSQLLGHPGATLWFTGLSGSGKSTIAVALERALVDRGHLAYRLDGDNIRHGLCQDLGFSAADRAENIRRVGEVSRVMADAGLLVLASFISPYREDRDRCRALHVASDLPFLEIHVHCSVETAEGRDPKGLYARARAGEIRDFTGVDAPYEEPLQPELQIRTDASTVTEAVQAILAELQARGLCRGS